MPLNLLKKITPLTENEQNIIKKHPELALEIIKKDKNKLVAFIPAILHHHERIDGQGYPKGLKETEINFYAKIISIADAFDAMTTDRPYRKKIMSFSSVLDEILNNTGTQFDPFIIEKIKEKTKNKNLKDYLVFKRVLNQKQGIYFKQNI